MENESQLQKRFEAWLQSLEQSLKISEDADSQQHSQILGAIQSASQFDKESLPSWVASNERVLSCLSSTSEDFKTRLRRLVFPKLFNEYDRVKNDLAGSTQLSHIDASPISLRNRNENGDELLTMFFRGLESNSSDVLVGLCKLIDYNSRASIVQQADEDYLNKLIKYEQQREQTSEQGIAIRTQVAPYLEGRDEENLISSSLETFRGEIFQLKVSLQTAQEEEEQARRVYEAAIEKTRQARDSVTKLESFSDLITTQSQALIQVNAITAQLDEFNRQSAQRRLSFLAPLQHFFAESQFRVIDHKLRFEFPVLLQNLHEIFRTMISKFDNASVNPELTSELSERPVSHYCAVRIGLETLRLWRRLQPGAVNTVAAAQLLEFENYLSDMLLKLPDFPLQSIGSSDQFQNSTVVLFFDHLYHDTPDRHVENQLRAESCLKLLFKKVQQQNRQHNLFFGIMKNTPSDTRGMVMEKCNDILSPPLWSLPLVHGPQYLTNLWKSSVEAQEEDLFVPLEFDTEWETADEDIDDELDEHALEKKMRRVEAKEFADINLQEAWTRRLGEDKAQMLKRVLSPRLGDGIVSRALGRSRRSVRMQSSREGADEDSDGSGPHSGARKGRTGRRVRTPYGSGTLIDDLNSDNEDAAREQQRIIRVKLDWGATGFLNAKDVQRSRRYPSATPRGGAPRLSVASTSSLPDLMSTDRFVHTNFTLHRLVRRILAKVKIQRLLLDKVGVKDAHMSLWLHGRTSRGSTKQVESGILNWFSKFNPQTLEAFLTEKEKLPGAETIQDSENFLKELESLKASDMPDRANAAFFSTNPDESREQLREEGFAYASSRLMKKSGEFRAKAMRSRKSFPGQVKSERVPASSTPSINKARTPGRPMRAPRLMEPRAMNDSDEALVRMLLHRLNSLMNLSQINFSREVGRRFGFQTTQTGVSSWVHHRASNVLSRTMDRIVFRWIDHHKGFLTVADREQWDVLAGRYPQLLTAQAAAQAEKTTTTSSLDVAAKTKSVVVFDARAEQDPSSQPTVAAEEMNVDEDNNGNDDSESLMSCGDDEGAEEEAAAAPTSSSSSSFANNKVAASRMDFDDAAVAAEEEEDEENEKQESAAGSSSDELVSVSEDEGDELEEAKYAADTPENALIRREFSKLHKEFVAEQNRRGLTHSYIAQECTRLKIPLAQPSISRFVREKTNPFINRAREFLNYVYRWLAYSRTKVQLVADSKPVDGSVCSGCGCTRWDFSSHKDFLVHIGGCPAHGDVVPLAARVNRFSCSGPFETVDLQAEQGNIATRIQLIEKNTPRRFRAVGSVCLACQSNAGNLVTCGLCSRIFHKSCCPGASDSSCFVCLSAIEKGLAPVGAQDLEPPMRVFVFMDEHAEWETAFVLNKKVINDRTLILLQVIRVEAAEPVYVWRECGVDKILVAMRDDSQPPLRKRGRKALTEPRVQQRRRVDDEANPYTTPARSVRRNRERSTRNADNTFDSSHKRRSRGRQTTEGDELAAASAAAPAAKGKVDAVEEIMTDTYLSADSLKAALCAAGSACRAVDIAMTCKNTNVFVCTRPPGHHAGRYGCTRGCLGTGFCLLNNAAIALTYARVRWGLERIAIVDIDAHFGNGTADILRGDESIFFASVHMIYGLKNDGADAKGLTKNDCVCGFYPSHLGVTEISDRFIAVGVQPTHIEKAVQRRRKRRGRPRFQEDDDEDDENDVSAPSNQELLCMTASDKPNSEFVGATGFVKALKEVVVPRLEAYKPQLLIISAGFDGCSSDPLGGQLGLSPEDYSFCTSLLTNCMSRVAQESKDPRSGKIVSLLEGGYDTSAETQGLARCVEAHVTALRANI